MSDTSLELEIAKTGREADLTVVVQLRSPVPL